MISKRSGVVLLISITVLLAIAASLTPRVPQPQSYHHFADQRGWIGVPRFGDVVSNVPFALIGLWGLALLVSAGAHRAFAYNLERIPCPRLPWPVPHRLRLGLLPHAPFFREVFPASRFFQKERP
jgi:hypothetical protein